MLNLPVCALLWILSVTSTLSWPVVACVASSSAGREGGLSAGSGALHCPELSAGWGALQPFEMKLRLSGQTLLHFCGFFSLTGRSVGKPEAAQHQKCTEGGKKSRISSEFKKQNPSSKRHAVRRCSRK